MTISAIPKNARAWREVLIPVVLLLIRDVGVTVLYFNDSTHFEGVDIQFTVFGTAIALFVGFMVNVSYARWWEARTLWGQVVNSSCSLPRQATVLIERDSDSDGLVD